MRYLWLLAGVLAALSFTPAVAGECDKIRSSYTRAVCNTPQLAAINQRLETTYAALWQKLGPQSRDLLARGQRSWRKYARLACTPDAKPPGGEYDSSGRDCLGGLLSERADWLARDWSIGDVQTFPLEAFMALGDPNPGAGTMVGSFSFAAVLIDANSQRALAFNRFVRNGYSDGLLTADNDLAGFTGESEVETTISIYEITSQRISSVLDNYTYFHGAAHGNSSITYEHFLVRPERALAASDIFAGPGWQDKLSGMVKSKIRSDPELAEIVWEDLSDVDRVAPDPVRWRFSPDGLQVRFQPYEITPYAYGLPVVRLNWDELGAILAPGALEIALAD